MSEDRHGLGFMEQRLDPLIPPGSQLIGVLVDHRHGFDLDLILFFLVLLDLLLSQLPILCFFVESLVKQNRLFMSSRPPPNLYHFLVLSLSVVKSIHELVFLIALWIPDSVMLCDDYLISLIPSRVLLVDYLD
jgi:hypothetical protein